MQIGILLQKVIVFLFQLAVLFWCILASAYPEILPFDILFVIYYISVLFIPVMACIVPRHIALKWAIFSRKARRINLKIDILLATIINIKYWSLTSELLWDLVNGRWGGK